LIIVGAFLFVAVSASGMSERIWRGVPESNADKRDFALLEQFSLDDRAFAKQFAHWLRGISCHFAHFLSDGFGLAHPRPFFRINVMDCFVLLFRGCEPTRGLKSIRQFQTDGIAISSLSCDKEWNAGLSRHRPSALQVGLADSRIIPASCANGQLVQHQIV
jgi:hypothetical protein